MLGLAQTVPPSEKLGLLPGWGWLVDHNPGTVFVLMLLISPVLVKFVIRPFIGGRILTRDDEFLTHHLDMLFAPALAAGIVLVNHMDDRVYFTRGVMDWLVLIGAIAFGVFHFWDERNQYTWKQLLDPSKVYHELLFMFIGYVLVMVCSLGFLFAPWSFELVVMRLLMVLCLVAWAASGPLYDEKRKSNRTGQSKFELAHTNDPWPWQHKYQYLGQWLKRYIADWREVPGRLCRIGQAIARL